MKQNMTIKNTSSAIAIVSGLLLCSLPFSGAISAYALPLIAILSITSIISFYLIYAPQIPGIKHHNTYFNSVSAKGWIAWVLGFFITSFYVALYFYDDLKAAGMPALLDRWVEMLHPLARFLHGGEADRWFLYGTMYTTAVLILSLIHI